MQYGCGLVVSCISLIDDDGVCFLADLVIFLKSCIKWVQESFPPGGDCSGLIVIYEQCVRTFWNDNRYKDDLRYLKVWLEYVSDFFYCISMLHNHLFLLR